MPLNSRCRHRHSLHNLLTLQSALTSFANALCPYQTDCPTVEDIANPQCCKAKWLLAYARNPAHFIGLERKLSCSGVVIDRYVTGGSLHRHTGRPDIRFLYFPTAPAEKFRDSYLLQAKTAPCLSFPDYYYPVVLILVVVRSPIVRAQYTQKRNSPIYLFLLALVQIKPVQVFPCFSCNICFNIIFFPSTLR